MPRTIEEVCAEIRPTWTRRSYVDDVFVGIKANTGPQGRVLNKRTGKPLTALALKRNPDLHVKQAIVVRVKKKVTEDMLAANQIFPKDLEGFPVDVQDATTSVVVAEPPPARATRAVARAAVQVIGGSRIARQGQEDDFGTMTLCVNFVADGKAKGPHFLTCEHVAFANTLNAVTIMHGVPPTDVLGTSALSGNTLDGLKFDAAVVECADVTLGGASQCRHFGRTVTISKVAVCNEGDDVFFTGAVTTGGFHGEVVKIDATHMIEYTNNGKYQRVFSDLILVIGKAGTPSAGASCKFGDSGSALIRESAPGVFVAVGLVIAKVDAEGGQPALTLAHPLASKIGVCKQMGVTL